MPLVFPGQVKDFGDQIVIGNGVAGRGGYVGGLDVEDDAKPNDGARSGRKEGGAKRAHDQLT